MYDFASYYMLFRMGNDCIGLEGGLENVDLDLKVIWSDGWR